MCLAGGLPGGPVQKGLTGRGRSGTKAWGREMPGRRMLPAWEVGTEWGGMRWWAGLACDPSGELEQ